MSIITDAAEYNLAEGAAIEVSVEALNDIGFSPVAYGQGALA